MSTTTQTISLLTVLIVIISGISYTVVKTNAEVLCKTGQGWTIISTHAMNDNNLIYKSECRYMTKPVVTAYCSSFRATATYPRYACAEIKLTEIPKYVLKPLTPDQGADELMYKYNEKDYYCKKNVGCVAI